MAEKIVLISSDGHECSVDIAVALQIAKNGDNTGEGIKIPQVTGEILSKVIEYCNKHVSSDNKELKKWDADFINMEKEMLFGVLMAADSLKIEELVVLASQTIADRNEGATVEEMRTYFNIKNDFTPEEMTELKKQMSFCFD